MSKEAKANKRKQTTQIDSTDSTESTDIIIAKKPKANSKTNSKNMDSESLAKAIGWIYLNTAYNWVFNCDSGCFYDTCQKSVHTEGIWMVIYQPLKTMLEYDDLVAAIIIKRIDNQPITQKMLSAAKPFIKQVENLYLQSYNDILSVTGNKWTHTVDGTLKQIMQIREPFSLQNGQLKMKFEIRGAVDGCCGDSWYPAKLMAFMGKSTKYAPINENGVVQDQEELAKFKYPATLAIIAE